jgi:hypothetical protein
MYSRLFLVRIRVEGNNEMIKVLHIVRKKFLIDIKYLCKHVATHLGKIMEIIDILMIFVFVVSETQTYLICFAKVK